MRNHDCTWKREALYQVIKKNNLENLFQYESEYEEKIFQITPDALASKFVSNADFYEYWMKDRVKIYDILTEATEEGGLTDGGAENDNINYKRTPLIPYHNHARLEIKATTNHAASNIIGYIIFYDEGGNMVDRYRIASGSFNKVISFTIKKPNVKYFRASFLASGANNTKFESFIFACSDDFTPPTESTN